MAMGGPGYQRHAIPWARGCGDALVADQVDVLTGIVEMNFNFRFGGPTPASKYSLGTRLTRPDTSPDSFFICLVFSLIVSSQPSPLDVVIDIEETMCLWVLLIAQHPLEPMMCTSCSICFEIQNPTQTTLQ